MTVQELIDELMKVEDKSKKVQVFFDGVYEDAEDVSEYNGSIVVY